MGEAEFEEKKISWGQRLTLSAINVIPLKLRILVFEHIGLLLYLLDGKHRRISERNLLLAFPDHHADQIASIARRVFRNLGRVVAEFTFLPRLNRQNLHRYMAIEGMENFLQARLKERGILFLTAHFGNWEWMAAAFPLFADHRSYVVVRPLDNYFLDGLVDGLRTWNGNKTISKQKSMGRLLRLLKEGETLGILLDQNTAWQEGVFVDFFGERACTNVGLALLAMKTKATVLPIFNLRQADGRYRIVIEPEVPLILTGNKEADVERNTQQYTGIIERYARNHPDHWFWLHQRWKTRPWQAKRPEKAAS